MPRSFNDSEKQNIKKNLITECAKCWSKYGYKKTSVDELCSNCGISKGAFYIFFKSKESLFCETLCLIHDRLYSTAEEIMDKNPSKYGIADVLKTTYREYCSNSFICNTKSVDFLAFTNKLSHEQLSYITEYSRKSGATFLDKPYLKYTIDKNKAISIIVSLLSMVSSKDTLCYDHFEVFDYMVDNLIQKIFE